MSERVRNVSLSVGTSSVVVSPSLEEGQRRVLVLTNTSTAGQIISVSWGQEASAGIGVVLTPYGSWSESVEGTFVPHNAQIYAVSSGASGTLSIHERIR